jgi:hypothetical protein
LVALAYNFFHWVLGFTLVYFPSGAYSWSGFSIAKSVATTRTLFRVF